MTVLLCSALSRSYTGYTSKLTQTSEADRSLDEITGCVGCVSIYMIAYNPITTANGIETNCNGINVSGNCSQWHTQQQSFLGIFRKK